MSGAGTFSCVDQEHEYNTSSEAAFFQQVCANIEKSIYVQYVKHEKINRENGLVPGVSHGQPRCSILQALHTQINPAWHSTLPYGPCQSVTKAYLVA